MVGQSSFIRGTADGYFIPFHQLCTLTCVFEPALSSSVIVWESESCGNVIGSDHVMQLPAIVMSFCLAYSLLHTILLGMFHLL